MKESALHTEGARCGSWQDLGQGGATCQADHLGPQLFLTPRGQAFLPPLQLCQLTKSFSPW